MTKTLGISHPSDPKKVRVWAEIRGKDDIGERFECLNGSWYGWLINERAQLKIDVYEESVHPCIVVWEGEIPYSYSYNYNEAIRYIEEQINGRE